MRWLGRATAVFVEICQPVPKCLYPARLQANLGAASHGVSIDADIVANHWFKDHSGTPEAMLIHSASATIVSPTFPIPL